MKLIWKYLMKYKKWFLLDFISVFGFALVELGIPTIISDMIDHGIEAQDTGYLYSRFGIMAFISVRSKWSCATWILLLKDIHKYYAGYS